MRKLVFVALLTALTCGPSLAQENPTALSPSEAYKAALAPLKAARAQPDDLTDADKFALAIGMAQASRDCLTLSSKTSALDANEKELIALGELCIFGQAYEPARATLVKYLSLPQPPEKKLAMVLLVRALLGLNEPAPAERVVRSLQQIDVYKRQTVPWSCFPLPFGPPAPQMRQATWRNSHHNKPFTQSRAGVPIRGGTMHRQTRFSRHCASGSGVCRHTFVCWSCRTPN